MPTLHLFLLFIAADLTLKLTPGPDMALTLSRGVTQGFRIAWLSVLGVFSAGFVQIPLVVLGLATVFRRSPAAFTLVKLAGALYLVYLGARALRHSLQKPTLPHVNSDGNGLNIFLQGFLTNLLNPKVLVFYIAFLPQFTDTTKGSVWAQMLVLATVSKFLGVTSGGTFAWGAARIRGWLSRNPWFLKVQEGTLGLTMMAVAAYLAMSGTSGA